MIALSQEGSCSQRVGDQKGGAPMNAWRSAPSVKVWSFRRSEKVAEPADKPGSVVDSHSSRRTVTGTLKQPTRTRRGPRHEVPIWSCSRWGLPCRSVTGLAVRSYRTISPLPACLRRRRRYLSVALVRRLAPPRRYLAPCPMEPGLSSASRRTEMRWDDATVWPAPPRALSHVKTGPGSRKCQSRTSDGRCSRKQPRPPCIIIAFPGHRSPHLGPGFPAAFPQ